MSGTSADGWEPSATTRLAAVIGTPIRHSLSPAIHNAAFRALDLDWMFCAFEVAEGDAPRALIGMRSLGLCGMSVTMPHKQAVAGAVDRLSGDAERLQAVNCVVRDGQDLVGHNTDGAGFVAGLQEAVGFDPAGASCVVLGAGGAARAVVLALARAGADRVTVINRTAAKAQAAAALAGAAGVVGDLAAIGGADLVVNATSIGMGAHSDQGTGYQGSGNHGSGDQDFAGPTPFDTDLLGEGQIVADLVMHPVITPLLRRAAARGAQPVGGVGMLVHQAALAFTLWTACAAPIEVMTAAARRQLA